MQRRHRCHPSRRTPTPHMPGPPAPLSHTIFLSALPASALATTQSPRATCSTIVGVNCTNSPPGPSTVKQCSYSPRSGYGPSAATLFPPSRSTVCAYHAPRRPIRFRRHPPFHVPSVHLRIFRLPPQLHYFPHQISCRIPILKLPANPPQPIPSPHHPVIRLAIPVHSARNAQSALHILRRFVPLSNHLDHSVF